MKTSPQGIAIPIPTKLNIVIAAASFALIISALKMASLAESTWGLALWAVVFALLNNTIFSLLHESVHRTFHPSKTINDVFGQACALFFPTGFLFQRAFHLGHHRRNRTDVEMFDMYYPTDNYFLKFVQLYTVLLGFYWTSAPIGGILYMIYPKILQTRLFRSKDPRMQAMSMDAMISGLDHVDEKRTRLELLVTLLFQVGLFVVLGISFKAWLVCYWSFAVLWGSLQYADHAGSVRDIRNGAWNLRVNKFVQYIFLNYHHHLAHHQNPYVPWIHLHKFVDFSKERPSHFKIWLKLWKGPVLTTEKAPQKLSQDFEKIIYKGLQDFSAENQSVNEFSNSNSRGNV